jgi:hypothetical protein
MQLVILLLFLACLAITVSLFWEQIESTLLTTIVSRAIRLKLFETKDPSESSLVSLGGLRVRPFSGLIEIHELRIGCPKAGEWTSPHVFFAQHLKIRTSGLGGFLTLPGLVKLGDFRIGFPVRKLDVVEAEGVEVFLEDNKLSSDAKAAPPNNYGFLKYIKAKKAAQKSLNDAKREAWRRKWTTNAGKEPTVEVPETTNTHSNASSPLPVSPLSSSSEDEELYQQARREGGGNGLLSRLSRLVKTSGALAREKLRQKRAKLKAKKRETYLKKNEN